MSFTHALSTNRYGEADLIVSTSAANGTHTTLASAMAAAVSGQTIFLRDSVTEDITITAGVNIAAWSGGSLNTPTIIGKLTMTAAGTSTISGLRLQTNSDFIIAVTGSAASILNVNECYLNCTNNTGISYTSSSSSSSITLNNCVAAIGTTGITLFSQSSAGTLSILYTKTTNPTPSTTSSTSSAGSLVVEYSSMTFPITTSGTASLNSFNTSYTTNSNNTCLTIGGSGQGGGNFDSYSSGSATAVTVTSAFTLRKCSFLSTNSVVAGGAGTITFDEGSLGISIGLVAPTAFTVAYNQYAINRSTQQPAFLAYNSATDTDVTGDGTSYTIICNTEVFDQNSDYNNGTGVFTSPLTGRYSLNGCVFILDYGAAHVLGNWIILTSNRQYTVDYLNPFVVGVTANSCSFGGSILADMDAADTASFVITVTGGTKTVDVLGEAAATTRFAGYLAC